MNIIDKKGMLFGKINIIDLSVVLILLFTVPAFIFSYKAIGSKHNAKAIIADKNNGKWVTAVLRFQEIEPELIKVIKEGDVEKDGSGKEVALLVKISEVSPSEKSVISSDSTRLVTVKDPVKKDMTVIMRVLCLEQSGIPYYKNYPVKIRGTVAFSTDMYDVVGRIIDIERYREPAK